ncbi:MAG: hypothetical protein ACKVVP_03730, partial [Chloroflexota bacterium]
MRNRALVVLGIVVLSAAILWLPIATAGAAPGALPDGIEDEAEHRLVSQGTGFNPAGLAAGVVQLSNLQRAKVGAPPLQSNEQLMKAAQDYSSVLAPGTCF